MKFCPKCSTQLNDDAMFCTACGECFSNNNPQQVNAQFNAQYQNPYVMNLMYNPYDHTSEFDAKDISDNKVMAMLVYLLGSIGIIIALLASNQSPFTTFHIRQALKFTVVNILMFICAIVLFWTFIVPIAYLIMTIVFWVIKIICFFQICCGKAKEPVIIRSLPFLK